MLADTLMGTASAVPASPAAEMAATRWRLRGFMGALMAALAAKAAILPAHAWLARRGFEAAYQHGWRIPAEIIGALARQLTLGSAWVPLMLAAVLPALACVWLLGHRLEEISRQILGRQCHSAASTGRARQSDFAATQDHIFRGTRRFEVLKRLMERGLDAMLWSFVGAAALLAWFLAPALLPGGGEIAGAAAFLVNLRLMMKPLSDIGKGYVKWREAAPAIATVYGRT